MSIEQKQGFRSLGRIFRAFRHSFDGLRHAVTFEAAFQQELIFLGILSVSSIVLPFSVYLKLQLLIAHVFILIVELLNSAVESLADKVCADFDPLIKQAKDTSSAAVLLAFIPAIGLWAYAFYTLT